ncbi:hypothetical protein VCV18_005577 [Metarhizium anisopliae]
MATAGDRLPTKRSPSRQLGLEDGQVRQPQEGKNRNEKNEALAKAEWWVVPKYDRLVRTVRLSCSGNW